jgi:Zn-dependent peptidase ImmA (M78 family)
MVGGNRTVKLVTDRTGRFGVRPHYKQDELDQECEGIVTTFLKDLHTDVVFPIATEDLHTLIEAHAEDLDAYADLSNYEGEVEGVTEFFPDHAPKVSISEKLSNDTWRENRLRTTLAHEFGHVYFHRPMWEEKFLNNAATLFQRGQDENKAICKRDTIIGAGHYDWMEWQAGYISGALLMPASHVRGIVSGYREENDLLSSIFHLSEHAMEIIYRVVETFAVSEEAAKVRLFKLNAITETKPEASLFD